MIEKNMGRLLFDFVDFRLFMHVNKWENRSN